MSANPLRLCFIGDSYVAGTGDPACLGWVGRVAAAAWAAGHDISTYSLGIRGETGPMLRDRWLAEATIRLPEASPGALVFQFGINDISERVGVGLRATPEDSAAAARAIMAEARRRWPVLWVGPPPANEAMSPMSPLPGVSYDFRNDRLLALNAAYAAIAREHDVPYLDIATPLSADAAYARAQREGDGMHCSAAGYALIARMVEAWPAWRALLRP